MCSDLPDFSIAQWDFLATMEAFLNPVSVDTAGAISPILPGEFLNLLSRCEEFGWIDKFESDCFGLTPNVPATVISKLKKINSPERLSAMLDRLESLNMPDQDNRRIMVNLLDRSGQTQEAAILESDIAQDLLKNNDYDEALDYFAQASRRLSHFLGNPTCDTLFVKTVLELSNLCFALGKGFTILGEFLEQARSASVRLGDIRSNALINLHLGRLFYFLNRRDEAFSALSAGWKEVNNLGDSDILFQSAEFLGLLSYRQGMLREAIGHLERANQAFESQVDRITNPLAPIFYGLCAAYLGQFHRAIGSLDCNWRLAMGRSCPSLASTIRSVLGTVLLLIKKKREGAFHLREARESAIKNNNALALYYSNGGLIYLNFLEGKEREAYDLKIQNTQEAAASGIIRLYSSPWILEILFAFEQIGYDPIPGWNFQDEIERVLKEPNIHLRGVALRLRAKMNFTKTVDMFQVQSDLEASEDYLKRSGNPIQLAKTWIEMARLSLLQGDQEKARFLAQKARQGLSGYMEEFYPDDLRHLLIAKNPSSAEVVVRDEFLQRLLELTDDIFPITDLDEILSRAVAATNRLFYAERGGLFWFGSSKGGSVKSPYLRASCNLPKSEVTDINFKSNLEIVNKAFKNKKPIILRLDTREQQRPGSRAILCIPVEVQGQVRGVLYHDNSYLYDCFEFLDNRQLMQLSGYISNFIGKIWNFAKSRDEKNSSAFEKSVIKELHEGHEFLTENPTMIDILNQAKVIAGSETPVLILGETGVGKELLAQKLHKMSQRASGPLVIVDATTIQENLVESELFGYEKGAFTGADRQKIGRLEMAHKGTLFIDEIGEISKSVQVKLLRALEKKTFVRVGGTRTLHSDFRLLAATNRDLTKEIAAGNFRQDLYYRLNVMTIAVPPLRKRPEDIDMLSNHFMTFFGKKHGRAVPKLMSRDRENLRSYSWPGNVRELKNVIERLVLLSTEDKLELSLPLKSDSEFRHTSSDIKSLDEIERQYIIHVLEKTGGRIGGPNGAASLLGLKRTTLYSKIKRLGVDRPSSHLQ